MGFLGFFSKKYDEHGFDRNGINKYTGTRYDKHGFDKNGIHRYTGTKYNEECFNIDGINKYTLTEYDMRLGCNIDGYDKDGFYKDGYNDEGYNRYGYDKNGLDKEGYDRCGFNLDGINKDTGTIYSKYGYTKEGFDKNGFDYYGYDRKGFNVEGYNRSGYDHDGFNKDGFDRNGYNRDGFNIDGWNKENINRFTLTIYDRFGYDREGFDYDGWSRGGLNKYTRMFYDENGFDKYGYKRGGFDKNGFNKEGYDIDGFDKEGYDKNGFDRNGYNRDGSDYYGNSKDVRDLTKKPNKNLKEYNQKGGNLLKICSIASGSNGNCYYIGTDNDAILIDDGISYRQLSLRMKEANLDINSVKGIFISHEHVDHVKGLPMFYKNHPNIPIYFNEMAYRSVSYSNNPSAYKVGLVNLEERVVNLAGFKIYPFKKKHDASYPLSFRVEYNGISVGVFTDIGEHSTTFRNHFSKCNAVFLEANHDVTMLRNCSRPRDVIQRIYETHFSNDNAYDMLNNYANPDLQVVIFVHISEDNNSHTKILEKFAKFKNKYKLDIASRYNVGKVYKIYK